MFEHCRRRVEADDPRRAYGKRASDGTGAAGKIDRALTRSKSGGLDDERKHVGVVQLPIGGKSARLAGELVGDCALMRAMLIAVHGKGSECERQQA